MTRPATLRDEQVVVDARIDNQRMRELFSLPPMAVSPATGLTVPTAPPQVAVTGDAEVDAVLWLRAVIATGDADLIARAREAAKRVKTPLKELERRYTQHLLAANPGNVFAGFSSFGFADLEDLAKRSVEKLSRKTEALARFGTLEALFADTPAEQFAAKTLRGLKRGKNLEYSDSQVDARFLAVPDLAPSTLADCIHEQRYWHSLWQLRTAAGGCGDTTEQASAREWFTFRSLARLPPRSTEEALAVFDFLHDESDRIELDEARAIVRNLIEGPRQ